MSPTRRAVRTATTVGAVALLALLGTACQRPVDGPSASGGTPPTTAAQEAGTSSVDYCSLVPAADVEELIGPNDGGNATYAVGSTADAGGCVWTNTTDYYSITIDCGQPGTAPGDVLPPWEPALGPEIPLADGMREFGQGSGTVEYAVAERDCTTQVVRSASGGDLDAAVELAGQVRQQLA